MTEARIDAQRVMSSQASPSLAQGDYRLYVEGYLDLESRSETDTAELVGRAIPSLAAVPTGIRAFDGSYGLAFVARDESCVYLVADFLGTRPIYYAETPHGWAWSFRLSQLSGQMRDRSVDLNALGEMLLYRWLMTERTLISGIKQVLPSHYVCLRPGQKPQVVRYADVHFHAGKEELSYEDVVEQTNAAFDAYLSRLRRRHSRVAVLFSGGVDSSLIAAKGREHGFERFIAVTANYQGHANPEAQRAEEIAGHLGVEFRRVEVEDCSVARLPGVLLSAMERPPTYINSFARWRLFESIASEVDFVLTGDAADVQFGNAMMANILRYAAKQRYVEWMPDWLRGGLSLMSGSVRARMLDQLRFHLDHSTRDYIREMNRFESAELGDRVLGQHLVPALAGLSEADRSALYRHCELADAAHLSFYQTRALYTGTRNHYIHYNLLSAPHGLRVGCPFECPEIFDIALGLPDVLKFDAMGPKAIVKRLAARFVPKELVYSSKMGFVAPLVEWMTGPLGEWRAMLQEERTIARGLFDVTALARLNPRRDAGLLWTAIGLELFCRTFIDV